jgi:hypothetical protein
LTADGSSHFADVVILAAGAQIGVLIDVENEVTAKAMCVAISNRLQRRSKDTIKFQWWIILSRVSGDATALRGKCVADEMNSPCAGMIFPPKRRS